MDQQPPLSRQATAAIELIAHTGATSFQLRYSNDEQPVVWLAVATFGTLTSKAAADINPNIAIIRLAEQLVDGGQCQHCKKITVLETNPVRGWTPTGMCIYAFDPDLSSFRRGCEAPK